MKKEYLYAAVPIFFWGSTAAVTKVLLEYTGRFQILFFSSLIATATLLVINLSTGAMKELRSYRPKDFLRLCPLGVLGLFTYYSLLYTSIDRMAAQDAFIINYLWPIMTVVFSCIFLREKITVRTVIALLLSFLGVAVVATKGRLLSFEFTDPIGILCSAGAAVAYGLFSALNKKESGSPFLNMMLFYGSTCICTGLLLVFMGDFHFSGTTPIFWAGTAWMGLLTQGLSYACWAKALKLGNTARISNLAFITPFLSLIYGLVLLKEPIELSSVIGLVFIVAGVLFQMKRSADTASA